MKYINSNLINFSSLGLVLSYMLFHNIYIVIAGISLSIYELNKKSINALKHYIFESNKKNNKKIKKIEIKAISEIIINKNAQEMKLVEEVEELGFIPSKNSNTNAA